VLSSFIQLVSGRPMGFGVRARPHSRFAWRRDFARARRARHSHAQRLAGTDASGAAERLVRHFRAIAAVWSLISGAVLLDLFLKL
jgi:hypothetical protein